MVEISPRTPSVQSTPRIWGFRKGAKPDFCLSEFSYYYEHPRIQKAIYGAAFEKNNPKAHCYFKISRATFLLF
jgi:hypothetical protein